MKNTCLKIAVITIILMTNSCNEDDFYKGEGELVSKEISIEEFNEIIVLGSHEVNISHGSVQKVEVTGHANIIDRIDKHVHDNRWYLELKKGNYRNSKLTFNIQLSQLNMAVVEGSGTLFLNHFNSNSSVTLGVLGSGKITTTTNTGCENLFINVEGSGKIYQTKEFHDLKKTDIEIIGSGRYDGFSNKTEYCNVNIEGSADCNVFVNSNLNGKIRGSGNINYIGNPTIESNISGSGKINNGN